jgi:hypothetical protein
MALSPAGAVLPSSGAAREKLREKGQFWTPDWVADAMVAWAMRKQDHLFDPAVGGGAFFRAAYREAARTGRRVCLHGIEIDPAAMHSGSGLGMPAADVSEVRIADFMEAAFQRRFGAIVANPPYVRHHRFPPDYKARLHAFATRHLGSDLDGRAGLHVFFLIKALSLLEEGGRLAFIVPADTCEGRFAPTLWRWIGRNYRIEGAATFMPDASPFPGVDTNPIILLISRRPPGATLRWARIFRAGTPQLYRWMADDLPLLENTEMVVRDRSLEEALATGLTREPLEEGGGGETIRLGTFFRVMRGIASGDNSFFFLDSRKIRSLGLPMNLFVRAIGRTRDHAGGSVLRISDLDALDAIGRPTYLLSLDRARDIDLPDAVRRYLRIGEEKGLPLRPLIAQRKPWFKMERREPPPWLFAYLGRRSCRFIRNEAGAVPLTGFLCVYPRSAASLDVQVATLVLNDPRTLGNLARVAKSYGGGALKVEPRNLEQLPIPYDVVRDHGLAAVGQPSLV